MVAGCSAPAAPPSSTPGTTSAGSLSLVALGDSVPHGSNCDCRPYPELTGDAFTEPSRVVTVANDAVGGYTSGDVLRQLDKSGGVIDRVRGAAAVEVEVGANDVGFSQSCGTSVSCYEVQLPEMEDNLTAIVSRVRDLTAGHRVLVVLLDYWSVWLGGRYAAEQGDAYVTAAAAVTEDVDRAIQRVAAGSGAVYVDLRAAFKGPSYSYDETHYLSDDGDHPNAAGHQQIAAAVVGDVESTLHVAPAHT